MFFLTGFAIHTSFSNAQTEWSHYGGSQKGLQYSPLDQVTKDNVKNLEVAWIYQTGEMGKGTPRGFSFQANPILVEGRLYISTGSGIVIALDPATGGEIWRYDPEIERDRNYAELANRGVSSWIDPLADASSVCRHRIFVGILDSRMIALDGESGALCADFGKGGHIYLNRDVRLQESEWVVYTITSPPVIVGDILISGSAIGDNVAVDQELGVVRGFDVRTGVEIWRWDPIPRSPDDPAYDTWLPEQVALTGAANAWPPLAADVERGLVFVPTGSPSPDFYGGERIGDALYGNSLVALDAATGKMVWYQQLIHHDVWDYDLASQPTLVELERDGKMIPAVLQATKTGLIFTFNRETGEPIFEIEERPVPQSGVPGEQLSPTQPFPVAPPPLVRHGPVTPDDAWGPMWIGESACADLIEGYRSEGIFTPPSLEGTILLPSYAGGINWGGIAFDPESQIAVVKPLDFPALVALIVREDLLAVYESGEFANFDFSRMTGTPYGMRRRLLMSSLDIPCIAPPWGTLAAVDMSEGKILWQVPLGTIEDGAPAIVPNLELGMMGLGGPIITGGGLIFVAGVVDNYLRAFDLGTGKELWKGRLPAGGQATPMTYFLEENGKQYIVISAGGHHALGTTRGDYVIAYTLGKARKKGWGG
ncbi:MAG: pyrroloquinoline quinone-dependent dehydrogenase [Sphingomonadales bacterium]